MLDSYRHQGLRKKLIKDIRNKGILDENVLKAMMEVPRHFFFDSSFMEYAYEDKPFPIAAGQTISQPYTVARQSELLEIKRGDKVLEIGTGSGYQASILIKMGAKVFTIERQKVLHTRSRKLLEDLGFRAWCVYGDGYKGLPNEKDGFNKIIVTAGAPFIPEPLKQQLRIGGILVIPVGEINQTMIRITRLSETEFKQEEFGNYKFVPLLEDKADDN